MKLHKVILLAMLCAFFSELNNIYAALTLPDPGTGSTTLFTRITSDYGPRYFTNQTSLNTNPHAGIDYGITGGGKAYAVQGGSITAINVEGTNSLIQINTNWEYIHMQCNGPYVQSYEFPAGSGNSVLVFRESDGVGGYNLEKILGRTVTFPPKIGPVETC